MNIMGIPSSVKSLEPYMAKHESYPKATSKRAAGI